MIVYLTEPDEIADTAKTLLTHNGYTLITPSLLHTIDPQDVRILFVRSYTKVDAQLLDTFPKLTHVLRAGVGMDTIDGEACKKRGITVFNAPGSNANAVAEYVLALMIMLLRQLQFQMKQLRTSQWRERSHLGTELKGKVIGVLGCGAVGRSLVEKLQPFHPDAVLGYDPFVDAATLAALGVKKCDVETIISESDIITLHLPLLKETENMFTEKEFNRMKKTAHLINTSRGGVVNEQHLVRALKDGTIAGAALDVFSSEPAVNKELIGLDNLILSPHIAGFTEEADEAMSIMPVEQLLRNMKE